MASPARFNFDLDFDSPPPQPRQQKPQEPDVPTVDLVTHLLQLGEADAKARAEGMEAGRASAEAQAARRLADEAAGIAHACRALMTTMDANRLEVEREATELALTIARKLAGSLIDREPIADIKALLAECLGPLRKAPHLVLRIHAVDADAIRPHVDRLVKESGFEGRMVILGEDDMARGDCRIEWADGGIIRNSKQLTEAVEASIGRYLAARESQTTKGLM